MGTFASRPTYRYNTRDTKDLLRRGTFGKTYRAVHSTTGKPAAVHVICKDRSFQDPRVVQTTAEEIIPFADKCPNLAKCINFYHDDVAYYVTTEWCSQGDLDCYLRTVKPFFITRLDIMKQCAAGIAFLHSQSPPIIHGHLTPHDVLVHACEFKDVVKITDYGFSVLLPSPRDFPNFLLSKSHSVFYPPEYYGDAVEPLALLPEVDVFSLGLIFLVILKHDGREKGSFPQTDIHDKFSFDYTTVPLGRIFAQDKNGVLMEDEICHNNDQTPVAAEITTVINQMVKPFVYQRTSSSSVHEELHRIAVQQSG